MKEALWKLRPACEEANALSLELGIPRSIAQILVNRSIDDPESGHRFLFGTLEHLYNPFQMDGTHGTR